MKTVVKICDNCKNINLDKIIKVIRDIDNDIEIITGCNNFCGICRTKAFIVLNNIPIIKETEADLIDEIKRKLVKSEYKRYNIN